MERVFQRTACDTFQQTAVFTYFTTGTRYSTGLSYHLPCLRSAMPALGFASFSALRPLFSGLWLPAASQQQALHLRRGALAYRGTGFWKGAARQVTGYSCLKKKTIIPDTR
jgi:hypothetical protein